MVASLVRILDGNTFVVSDERGDIEASKTDPTGLFSYDIRFLSTWVLTVNDLRLNALSTDDLQYFEARFFLVPATGTVYIDARRAGGLDVLRSLTASTVEEVRYLGPTQSQNEYGPRATLFTLVVRLRRPRPDTTFGVTLSSR